MKSHLTLEYRKHALEGDQKGKINLESESNQAGKSRPSAQRKWSWSWSAASRSSLSAGIMGDLFIQIFSLTPAKPGQLDWAPPLALDGGRVSGSSEGSGARLHLLWRAHSGPTLGQEPHKQACGVVTAFPLSPDEEMGTQCLA